MTYSSKLVDLPCIVESQKTYDSRHLFKVADISQVLSLLRGKAVGADENGLDASGRSTGQGRSIHHSRRAQSRRLYLATRAHSSSPACPQTTISKEAFSPDYRGCGGAGRGAAQER
jgi:hypothetical protein